MLRSFDSWIAVAIAMVAARAGIPRCTAIAVMSAALAAWSGSSSYPVPSTLATQVSRSGGTYRLANSACPMAAPDATRTATTSRARPRRRQAAARVRGAIA